MKPKPWLLCLPMLALGVAIGRWTAPAVPVTGDGAGDHGIPRRLSGVAPGHRDADNHVGKSRLGYGRTTSSGESSRESVEVSLSSLRAIAKAWGTSPVGDQLLAGDDPLTAALQITEDEKLSLNQAWQEARNEIRAAEASRTRFEDHEDGSVSFTVDPASDVRHTEAKRLHDTVTGLLGDLRGDALMALKGCDDLLEGVSLPVAYSLGVEPNGSDGWRFRIVETEGDSQRVWIADAIPPELTHLTDAGGIARRVNEPRNEDAPE